MKIMLKTQPTVSPYTVPYAIMSVGCTSQQHCYWDESYIISGNSLAAWIAVLYSLHVKSFLALQLILWFTNDLFAFVCCKTGLTSYMTNCMTMPLERPQFFWGPSLKLVSFSSSVCYQCAHSGDDTWFTYRRYISSTFVEVRCKVR